jgi:hypothetical protein
MFMSAGEQLCAGAKEAIQITEYMSETFAMFDDRRPLTPEREAFISQYMRRRSVGFFIDDDPISGKMSYDCKFDCSRCLGKTVLSLKGEVAIIGLPTECPDYPDKDISVITIENALQQVGNESI